MPLKAVDFSTTKKWEYQKKIDQIRVPLTPNKPQKDTKSTGLTHRTCIN